jgi:DNA-binding transcriptional ArsR family regulator
MTLTDFPVGSFSTSDGELSQLTALFRLLSDKTRLNIVVLLAAGERNVTSLCNDLRLPQPTVSHHLGLLRESGVVGNRRSGKQVFYHLNGQIEPGEQGLGIHTGGFVVRLDRTGQGFSIASH